MLDNQLRFKPRSNIRFAGQITGVEGYVESASIGLLAGRFASLEIFNKSIPEVPINTAIGSLVNHITGGAHAKTFQPMNVNFGLFPAIEGLKVVEKAVLIVIEPILSVQKNLGLTGCQILMDVS